MKEYINKKGKWKNKGKVHILIEPSEEYKKEKEKENKSHEEFKLKQEILNELQQLDKEIPRLLEDIIEHIGYRPHQSKLDIIKRKRELRSKL